MKNNSPHFLKYLADQKELTASAMARALGWSRQRMHEATQLEWGWPTGTQVDDVISGLKLTQKEFFGLLASWFLLRSRYKK